MELYILIIVAPFFVRKLRVAPPVHGSVEETTMEVSHRAIQFLDLHYFSYSDSYYFIQVVPGRLWPAEAASLTELCCHMYILWRH